METTDVILWALQIIMVSLFKQIYDRVWKWKQEVGTVSFFILLNVSIKNYCVLNSGVFLEKALHPDILSYKFVDNEPNLSEMYC